MPFCEMQCLSGFYKYRAGTVVQCLTEAVYEHTIGLKEVPVSLRNATWRAVVVESSTFSSLTALIFVAAAALLSGVLMCT